MTKTAAPYAPLLERTEDHASVFLDPADAAKLVTRLRGVRLFVRTAVDLVTELTDEGRPARAYEGMGGNVPLSAAQARRMLDDMANFNERKAARGDATGTVEVTRLGDCLFIG